MSDSSKKSTTIALGTVLAGGLVLAGSTFSMQALAAGYVQSADAASKDKAGEGGCGVEKMDGDKDGKVSKAEFAAAHGGKSDQFASHDPNGDGYIDAAEMDAHHEVKAADKGKMEGKCGEGKCGGSN